MKPYKTNPLGYENKSGISANQSGFIQYIDFSGLIHYASENQILINFQRSVGEFVKTGDTLLHYHGEGGKEEDIHSFIYIGRERMGEYDLAYSLQKIVEVALRAISPGINDPNTARDSIKYMGLILSETHSLEDGIVILHDEKEIPGSK